MNKFATAVTATVLVGVVSVGFYQHQQGDAPKAPARAIQTIGSYELQPKFVDALNHTANDSVLEGIIQGTKPAQEFATTTESGDKLSYIYTPVAMKVTKVFKAGKKHLKIDQIITIRVIGGVVGSKETVSHLNAPPSAFVTGLNVTVFTQPAFTTAEGQTEFTPNWVFALNVDGTELFNLADPDVTTSAAQATGVAEEKAAWSGWHDK